MRSAPQGLPPFCKILPRACHTFTTKPLILEVAIRASSCGWVAPSKSSSPNSIDSLLNFGLFPSRSLSLASFTKVTLRIPLRWLKFMPIEPACITSITPNGGGSVFPQFLEVCPSIFPSGAAMNSFKSLDFTSCTKWSLNTLHYSIVCPFSWWYIQYKF